MADDPDDTGDRGDSIPDGPSLKDTRLCGRAIRERWPMPLPVRVKILNRLVKIVDEDAIHDPLPVPNHAEVISAARTLIVADKINLDAEKLDMARARDGLNAADAEALPPRLVIPPEDVRPDEPPSAGGHETPPGH